MVDWNKIKISDNKQKDATINSPVNWNKITVIEDKTPQQKGQELVSNVKGAISTGIKKFEIGSDKFKQDFMKNVEYLNTPEGEAEYQKARSEREEREKKLALEKTLNKKPLLYKAGATVANVAGLVGKGLIKGIEGTADAVAWAAGEAGKARDITVGGMPTGVTLPYYATKELPGQKEKAELIDKRISKFIEKDYTAKVSKKIGLDNAINYLDKKSIIKSTDFLGQSAQAIGGMIPTLVTGSSIPMAIQSFGGSYEEAINSGATQEQAVLYGAASSAVETATEWLTGGIPGIKGSAKYSLDSIIAKRLGTETIDAASKSLAKAIIKAGYKVVGEAGEEALAEIGSALLKKATYDPNAKISWKNVMESAIVGGITGGILNIPGTITDVQGARQIQAQVPNQVQPTQPIAQPQVPVTPREQTPITEQPTIQQPITTGIGETKQRGVYQTSLENQFIPQDIKKGIKNIDQNYMVITDENALKTAQESITNNGLDNSFIAMKDKITKNERISKNDIAEMTLLYNEAYARGDSAKALDLLTDIAVAGTESGQVAQATSLIQRMTPDGRLMALQKQVNKINNDFTKKGKDLGLKIDTVDMENIKNAKNKIELDNAVQNAIENISKKVPKTAGDYINEWRYTGMLGNPKTHIRNIVSNMAMKGVTKIKDIPATLLETVFNPEVRTKTFRKPSQETIDFVNKDIIDQKSRIQGTDKYDFGKGKIKPKESAIAKFNSNLLEFEDWLFSSRAYKKALANYITANNYNINEITPKQLETARDYAVNQAQEQTFRQYSELANTLGKIQNKNIFTKIAVGGVVPFKTTPINIAKTGVEYSPIGLAKTITKNSYDLAKGNIDGAKYIDNLSKGLTGTGVMALGMVLANMGILKASGSDEDKKNMFDKAYGFQSYSLQIGGKSYTLDWLSPAAIPLFAGAEVIEMQENGSDSDDKLATYVDALSTMLNPLTEMSMLQGLSKTLSSYEQNKLMGVVMNTAENYAGQFVPTILGQVARTVDTTRRDTTGKGKGLEKKLNTFMNKQMAKIPFVSQTLEPYLNVMGEKDVNKNMWSRAAQNFLSPAYIKKLKSDKIQTELTKIYKNTGSADVLPNFPQRYIMYNKEQYYLEPKEYTRFTITRDNYIKKELNDLFNKYYYKDLSDEEKTKIIKNIYDDGRELAKQEYLNKKELD